MDHIRIKEILYCGCDTVDLCKCTDTKQTDTGTEKSENFGKPASSVSHTIFNIVERTAENMAFIIDCTVFDR